MSEGYEAVFRSTADVGDRELAVMTRLYLNYYDNADETHFNRDFRAKTEVEVLYYNGELVGFSTLLFYESEWRRQKIRVVYSGDTIVHRSHWGQQTLAVEWLRRMGRFVALDASPLYWFLLVKGHRTYRFLPSFAWNYHPAPDRENPELKAVADMLAQGKFGADYNPDTGVVEFKHSLGNLKEEVAYPSQRELKNPDVRFFMHRNPGYLKGHEMVCLCPVSSANLKPFARRIFEAHP